jgi:hypothetical protein
MMTASAAAAWQSLAAWASSHVICGKLQTAHGTRVIHRRDKRLSYRRDARLEAGKFDGVEVKDDRQTFARKDAHTSKTLHYR